MCVVAVLTAGTPARGFVWCRQPNGTSLVEAGGPASRCSCVDLRAAHSHAAAPASLSGGGCTDVPLVGGILLPRSERLDTPAPVAVAPAALTLLGTILVAASAPSKTPHSHPPRYFAPGSSFVSKTVVILV